MTDEMLPQAIALAQAGQKDQARDLLQQVLNANPTNETAWLWLTDCVTDPKERIQVLETCLHFVPHSRAAQAGLAALRLQVSDQEPHQATVPPQPADETQTATDAAIPAAPAEPVEDQDEWPNLREQIQLEPWMEEMSDDAGPALGALLGNEERSEGLPGHARAYDNLPTLPARHFEQPSAFTISPDEVTQEEFSEVENRTEAELRNRPETRPELETLPIEPWEWLPETDEPADQVQPVSDEERIEAGEPLVLDSQTLDHLPAVSVDTHASTESPNLGQTAPHHTRRKVAARKKATRNRTILFLLLFILGLIAIAAVLFAIILSL